jgi:hypothetical protein
MVSLLMPEQLVLVELLSKAPAYKGLQAALKATPHGPLIASLTQLPPQR